MNNEQQHKNRGGRPTYEPHSKDRNIVLMATAFAIPQERIALALGISDRTHPAQALQMCYFNGDF